MFTIAKRKLLSGGSPLRVYCFARYLCSPVRVHVYVHRARGLDLADVRGATCARRCSVKFISMPIVVAPTAFHKLACDEGEIAAGSHDAPRSSSPLNYSTCLAAIQLPI